MLTALGSSGVEFSMPDVAQVIVTFVRTIETSDFDRRLQIVETSQAAQRSYPPGIESGIHHSTKW